MKIHLTFFAKVTKVVAFAKQLDLQKCLNCKPTTLPGLKQRSEELLITTQTSMVALKEDHIDAAKGSFIFELECIFYNLKKSKEHNSSFSSNGKDLFFAFLLIGFCKSSIYQLVLLVAHSYCIIMFC